MPEVELGLAIIGLLGPKILPLVYLCTVVGLSVSYLAGRLVALETLAVWFEDLRFDRAAAPLRRIAPMSRDERLACLVDAAPHRLVPTLPRHRYLAIAVALNLPGNILLGGGGGIALVAGVSGLYSPLAFVVTTAIAIAPVPLAIVFLGAEVLAG